MLELKKDDNSGIQTTSLHFTVRKMKYYFNVVALKNIRHISR